MSFRKYGGLDKAATNNIVRNHYSNSDSPTISNVLGQPNTKIVTQSHIDMSGNSILNIGTLYFINGTSISSGPLTTTLESSDKFLTNDDTITKLLKEIEELKKRIDSLENLVDH